MNKQLIAAMGLQPPFCACPGLGKEKTSPCGRAPSVFHSSSNLSLRFFLAPANKHTTRNDYDENTARTASSRTETKPGSSRIALRPKWRGQTAVACRTRPGGPGSRAAAEHETTPCSGPLGLKLWRPAARQP